MKLFVRLPSFVAAFGLGALLAGLDVTGARAQTPAIPPAQPIPDRPEQLTFPPLRYEPPAPADFRVPLRSGPIAYVVPDRDLPLVNVAVLVRVGEYLERTDQAGLASLTGYLLARGGTRSHTAEALEERLAFLAAVLNSGIGDTQGSVSLNLLSKDVDEGLTLLREVLATPRFQADKIALRKQQILQAMQQRNDDSGAIEQREAGFLAFGEGFWLNRYATAASVERLTAADLHAFHQQWFTPSNFIVAASGDFERDAFVAKLEQLFADWPFSGGPPPPVPTNTTFAPPGVYLVDKDVNQARVSVLLPGIRRDDPDYFACIVMNDILGGGGFTSRIMNRVRSEEGLAYAAGSGLPGGVYYPLTFTAAFQTKPRTVAYATSIVLDELRRMIAEPVTEAELHTAKRGFIDRFPRTFASKAQVAGLFAQEEFTGRYARDPAFWQQFRARMEAVTQADVQRAAQRVLQTNQLVILTVGQKTNILQGHPNHPVRLQDFAPQRFLELPLRDPLTMQPLGAPKPVTSDVASP